MSVQETFGIVVIGRNEAERLPACFDSIVHTHVPYVYVDSDSTDDSLAIAKRYHAPTLKVEYVSAAYARNKGAEYLLQIAPSIHYIQFIDGDTTLAEGWLEKAVAIFSEQPNAVILSGNLEEKDAHETIYKVVSMLEWQRAAGETHSCGGNLAMRVEAFRSSGGFNPKIVGGEDTELCTRLRLQGKKIVHVDARMGTHHTKINTFKDFWRRNMRTGHGFQQISLLYLHSPEKLFLRENLSHWFYGGIIPLLTLLLVLTGHLWGLWLLLIYPLLFLRIYYTVKDRWPPYLATRYALLCTIGKFPGFLGAVKQLLGL